MSTVQPGRTYAFLYAAYDHFNRLLFAGKLPHCLITMQRHKGAYGYFSLDRFAGLGDAGEVADEIALNPTHIAQRPPAATLSTLVHEMVHCWQCHFGTPSRRGYHNKEWAAKMREIGLIPSHNGEPGGQETGDRVTHYVDPDGLFDRACAAYLADSPVALYGDRQHKEDKPTRRESKLKYTCPGCGYNVWGAPGGELDCRRGHGARPMASAPPGGDTRMNAPPAPAPWRPRQREPFFAADLPGSPAQPATLMAGPPRARPGPPAGPAARGRRPARGEPWRPASGLPGAGRLTGG